MAAKLCVPSAQHTSQLIINTFKFSINFLASCDDNFNLSIPTVGTAYRMYMGSDRQLNLAEVFSL